MNSKNSGYIEYLLDILSSLGDIKTRKMFGGYGIYKNGVFFAIIVGEMLYFKVDAHNLPDYEKYDSKPFSYEGKNKKTITMSYWEVPADVLEDHSLLELWVRKAVMAAQRAKKSVILP
jgi:DNA transformation protein and related proteins